MKLIKVIVFIAMIFGCGAAILAPLAGYIVAPIIFLIIVIAYGKQIATWAGSFMED